MVVACDDPLPTESEDGHADTTDELQVDLTVSPDHVHILSEVTFTADVTDHHDEPVTDFESIHVEYSEASSGSWSQIELALDEPSYVGSHTFTESGDYDIRVTGMRAEDPSPVVMYEMPDALEAGRAHADAGGYGVEFEAFPGHIHDGDTGTLRFWVTETDGDPVTGLTATIQVTEANASVADLAATETSDGVYEADHTFGSAGEAGVALQFTGTGGVAEAEFAIHIAEAHG